MFCIDTNKVRGKLAEKGMTLTDFAKELNVSLPTLRKYMVEPMSIPYKTLDKMAELLCASPKEAAEIFFARKLT